MTDYVSRVIDELVPGFDDERGDWTRVVDAAGVGAGASGIQRRRDMRRAVLSRLPTRRLAIALVVAAAITIPVVAIAGSQEWWFFRFGAAPTPVTGVTVIKTGTWDGRAWQLTAYRSSTQGVCFQVGPVGAEHAGEGSAGACDQIEGVPRSSESRPSPPHAITFLAGLSDRLPPHIVGPVIATADQVAIYLADGSVVRTPTFEAPEELGSIRFFATQIELPNRPDGRLGIPVRRLVGLTDDGQVVACLVVPMPDEGVPLSACQ